MLNKISRAIADDWKQDPYYLLAEKSVDNFWGGGGGLVFLGRFKGGGGGNLGGVGGGAGPQGP
ncbi:MAG: hypothetical protein K2N07_05820, partial [Desulfovibrio sp.]|nr:hypothetical protein [Desulfovibrio sp.]